jgi:hypothetical protein
MEAAKLKAKIEMKAKMEAERAAVVKKVHYERQEQARRAKSLKEATMKAKIGAECDAVRRYTRRRCGLSRRH